MPQIPTAPGAASPDEEDPASSPRSPGGYWKVPGSFYDPYTSTRSARGVSTFEVNDRRRARNAAMRDARITAGQDSSVYRRNVVDSVADKIGRPSLPANADDASVQHEAQRIALMSQTDTTRNAQAHKVNASYAAMPAFDPYARQRRQAAIDESLRKTVAAVKANVTPPAAPTPAPTPAQRMQTIAPSLKPGDAVGVTVGGTAAAASNPVVNGRPLPTVQTVTQSPPPAPRRGMVSEDGGRTWKPIASETARIARQTGQDRAFDPSAVPTPSPTPRQNVVNRVRVLTGRGGPVTSNPDGSPVENADQLRTATAANYLDARRGSGPYALPMRSLTQ